MTRPRQGFSAHTRGRQPRQGDDTRDLSAARAYTSALALLGRREISAANLRTRLIRRGFEAGDVDDVIARLTKDGTVDDRRTAAAAARLEGAIRLRGRRRVLQKVRSLGVDADVAETAVNGVFAELDETALLDRAIARRLKGLDPRTLDRAATARIVRGLIGQGFSPDAIFRRLRAAGTSHDEDS